MLGAPIASLLDRDLIARITPDRREKLDYAPYFEMRSGQGAVGQAVLLSIDRPWLLLRHPILSRMFCPQNPLMPLLHPLPGLGPNLPP